jgi:hypothetical protein
VLAQALIDAPSTIESPGFIGGALVGPWGSARASSVVRWHGTAALEGHTQPKTGVVRI